MNLHPSVQSYFDADRRRDQKAVTDAFAPDASVRDEGLTHLGRPAIGEWWSETKARYQTTIELLDAWEVEGATVVRARIAGEFPNSPAILSFAFQLADGRITRLEIGA